MRILVTGSRDWDDEQRILDMLWCCVMLAEPPYTLVSGACPTGADAIAERLATETNLAHPGTWIIERHPAEWDTHGRAAGPLRNKQMVDLGADVCLAFIGACTSPRCKLAGDHPSHGASGCADLAEQAGINTKRYYA